MLDLDRLRAAYLKARDDLLAERTPNGHWIGELSSSALSTATAVSAICVVRRIVGWDKAAQAADGPPSLQSLIDRGVAWLLQQQNPDGGFGDTDLSHSNIATTYLVIAALHLAGVADQHPDQLQRANAYIDTKGRLQGLRDRYGIDKTFVVPIMTNLALADLVEWHEVDPLPFELACVPQSWYRFVGMPVVSYAIPALVAIGQARYHHAPPRNPITRLLRQLSITRSLSVLRRMQPDSGGYLEATPLTSFVVMGVASTKHYTHSADEVIREGVKFLINSIRPNGSWPIDTNLATWNTTLAINALAGSGEDIATLLGPQCRDWLLSCQHTKPHPFTGANPGGFGWSDLSGAVPDADDTPGGLLALRAARTAPASASNEARFDDIFEKVQCCAGWLLRLRNGNGGWPTFCRGWGKLPFDRSGTDLTAHAMRALHCWRSDFAEWDNFSATALIDYEDGRPLYEFSVKEVDRAVARGFAFLQRLQHPDGSWSPLWFGNQDDPHEENRVYGTAKVLMAYRDLGLMDSPEAQRGIAWLVANQNNDGGWGSGAWTKQRERPAAQSLGEPVPSTPQSGLSTSINPKSQIPNPQSAICNLQSSLEETALAVEALLAACPLSPVSCPLSPAAAAALRGLSWLLDRVENNQHRQPAPIGFYFAKLWYYEKLYPLTFTVAALGRACRQFAPTAKTASSDAT